MPEEHLNLDALLEHAARQACAQHPTRKAPPWTVDEIAFLCAHHGDMTDYQIAEALGRSEQGVKIYRVRQGLPAASQAGQAFLTSNQAAKLLKVEIHAFTWWCEYGLLPFTMAGPNRQIRLLKMRDLTAWVVNPRNWVYFDWRRIRDPHLRRLCELRQQRWGDEWWTTRQVADYHGVDVKDVTRLITKLKRLPGLSPAVSKAGRHPNRRWSLWFVKKSDALKARFVRRGDDMSHFTPGGDAWIVRARNVLGLSWAAIGRTMGSRRKGKRGPDSFAIRLRYDKLMSRLAQAEEALAGRV